MEMQWEKHSRTHNQPLPSLSEVQAWGQRVLGAPGSGLGGGMGATEAGTRVSLRGEGEERLKTGGQRDRAGVFACDVCINPSLLQLLNSLHFHF